MVILTDCLQKKVDEGCIKVANTLSRRIKEVSGDTTIVSYGENSSDCDINLRLNPLFLNNSIRRLLKEKDTGVLYIPFASNTLASTLRTFVLSLMNKKKVAVLFSLRHPMNAISRMFLKLSGATVIALSNESYEFYRGFLGDRVEYIKTGVDTEKFVPVENDTKAKLVKKYGLPSDKTLVLHIGHLNYGRNVDKMLLLDDDCHAVLVLSSVTKAERDPELYEKLKSSEKVTIIDEYIENVEQMYQLCDVYLFPVCEQGRCIDVPLSALEAASCGVPVVCTRYGELASLNNTDGFTFIEDFSADTLNKAVKQALRSNHSIRETVLEYDWNRSIKKITDLLE